MSLEFLPGRRARRLLNASLLSASYLALSVAFDANVAWGQSAAPAEPSASNSAATRPTGSGGVLPTIRVTAPKPRRTRARPQRRGAAGNAPQEPPPAPGTHDARTGTVGIYANSTSVATKTNTPILNIPQSLNVVTKQFIQDQNLQNITDVARYVPGVAVHQGEGNRDELVIRGVDSSANFFVNGFRDDVQIFRDFYNTQSVEVLKGPSALTFGRGAGGGIFNRTLKEADGTRIYEMTGQTGSYNDRRVTLDAGQAINPNFAARLNMMYEKSDTFRDYGKLERYGINPTVTLKPNDTTTLKLNYEYFHDERTADRGNPSLGIGTRFNPTEPFAPGGDLTKYFGSPDLNVARADVHSVMGVIDHDFGNGLTVKNSTRYANYQKFYQNVFPGSSVDPATGTFSRSAYQHTTNRENIFNQTDFVYKTGIGPTFHTFAFGTEFGWQSGIDFRNSGLFPNGTLSETDSAFSPTYFGSITFAHQPSDSNSDYHADIQSAYARDTIELLPWLQLIGGGRIDRFDLSALDRNINVNQEHTDTKISPQAAVIVKPADNLSVYGAYSVSYLPASGDQFSRLTPGTAILEPQKFENKEVGLKWNILPKLQYTAAVYNLDRFNVPLADPTNPGFFILSGKNRIRGFETGLNGYILPNWQSSLGYAYTDARVTSDTSATIVAGNRIQLVPFNQFSFWNKVDLNSTWAAALGIIHFSDSFASSDDSVRLPDFTRVDAALYAKINETWRLQLNVENVFDVGYWASADGNNNISPGQPRTFRLLAIAKF